MFKHVEHLWNTPGSFFNLDSTFIRCIIFVYMHILLFSFRLKKKKSENNFAVEHMQIVCALFKLFHKWSRTVAADHRWHDFITSTIDNILWWSKSVYETIWSRHTDMNMHFYGFMCLCPFLFRFECGISWACVCVCCCFWFVTVIRVSRQMHLNYNVETYDPHIFSFRPEILLRNNTWPRIPGHYPLSKFGISPFLKQIKSNEFIIALDSMPLHLAFGYIAYILECQLRSEASFKCKANNWTIVKRVGDQHKQSPLICICKSWNYVRFRVVILVCSLFTFAKANDFLWTLTFHWILCRNEMPNNG